MGAFLRAAVLSGLFALLVACGATPERNSTEGMSQSSPARIAAATPLEIEGLQRAWIAGRFPGATPDFSNSRYILSTLVIQKVPVKLSDGREVVLFFNITLAQ